MSRMIPLLAAVLFAGMVLAPAAHAATCSDQRIEAKGEQSRFLWLAKTKARANWRRKVRTTPRLGAGYANWARAENTEERCLSGRFNHLCVFSGNPCRN